ncbi:MAG: iron-containing alcohol dehydrogenase [Myxococcales bacterium]|nr:iron-containing alcohol dehydrogenase [Myxococcales bacterium]
MTPGSRFELYSAGRLVFGRGAAERIGALAEGLGARALLVVGGRSAEASGLLARLEAQLSPAATARCTREPRVEDVDAVVQAARAARCDHVVAVGGGAVLDCAKAAAALLTNPGELVDYLEGVGAGRAISVQPAPMLAAPTTAGTGSEVTKNAVVSGEHGGKPFKKSVRAASMIPDVALVDPELTRGAPPALTAACGMDALTQVIEPYLSSGAGPITDALALTGICAAARGLERAYRDGDDLEAREEMALASVLGGLCLANAGLGAVHGFASPLGAHFPIAHGVCCAALLAPVMRANYRCSRGSAQGERIARRLADVAQALGAERDAEAGIERVEALADALQIPRLGELGLSAEDIPTIVAGSRGSSMRYNPIELSDEQLSAILAEAM